MYLPSIAIVVKRNDVFTLYVYRIQTELCIYPLLLS